MVSFTSSWEGMNKDRSDPSERTSAKSLQDTLCNTLEYSAYPLRNHQGSPLEQEQDIFRGKIFYERILYNKIFNQVNYHPVFFL